MSADPDRALLATSLAFAGAAVLGSAVAIREDLPGQPCGISVPLPVPAGLLAGWGAGVAAPWPMPAAAVIAAARSQRTQPRALTGAVCAGSASTASWAPPSNPSPADRARGRRRPGSRSPSTLRRRRPSPRPGCATGRLRRPYDCGTRQTSSALTASSMTAMATYAQSEARIGTTHLLKRQFAHGWVSDRSSLRAWVAWVRV